jgi:hypothetical protein
MLLGIQHPAICAFNPSMPSSSVAIQKVVLFAVVGVGNGQEEKGNAKTLAERWYQKAEIVRPAANFSSEKNMTLGRFMEEPQSRSFSSDKGCDHRPFPKNTLWQYFFTY